MNTQGFQIEVEDKGYLVINDEGFSAFFSNFDEAYQAFQEFRSKSFPDNWAKTPPAMRSAKKLYHSV